MLREAPERVVRVRPVARGTVRSSVFVVGAPGASTPSGAPALEMVAPGAQPPPGLDQLVRGAADEALAAKVLADGAGRRPAGTPGWSPRRDVRR